MARRTTPQLVRDILGVSDTTNVDGFIDTATKLVDKVQECAGGKLDDQHLELIERWLSCHFYASVNPSKTGLKSKQIAGASKTYNVGEVGMDMKGTQYGQQALAIDTSGCLERLTGETMDMTWLGDDEEYYETRRNPIARRY